MSNTTKFFNGVFVPGVNKDTGNVSYWFNGLPKQGLYPNASRVPAPPNINTNVTGVAGSGSAGTVGGEVDLAFSGVSATGSAGTLVGARDAAVIGTQATASAGILLIEADGVITGAAATGSAGSVLPEVDAATPGVSATGSVGIITQPSQFLFGASGTGHVGSIIPEIDFAISGVASTGSVGSVIGQSNPILSGVAATGSAGTASDIVAVNVPGISVSGAAGTVTVSESVSSVFATGLAGVIHTASDHAFSGVQASARTGTVTPNVGGYTGTGEAIGGVGNVGIDIKADIGISGVAGIAGTGTTEGAKAVSGNFALGQSGLMRGNPAANLYSVGLSGLAGSFAFSSLASIQGAAAIGATGTIVGTIPQPMIGVAATGQVGTIAKNETKLITGVQATGHAQQFTSAFLRGNAATAGVGTIAKVETKLITGVIGTTHAGTILGNVSGGKLLYLTTQTNFGSLVENVQPPHALTSTGWNMARNGNGAQSIMKYGTMQPSSTFAFTTQLNAAPTAINGNSWRSFGTFNGTFAAGTWTVKIAFQPTNNGASSGQVGTTRVRIWKSPDSNGAGAVQITTGEVGSNSIGSTAGFDQVTACTFTAAAPVNFSNEYLFVEVEWDCGAPGNNNADGHIVTGANSFVQTPLFVAAALAINGVVGTGGVGTINKIITHAIPGVVGQGGAGAIGNGYNIGVTGVFAVCDHGVFDFIVAKTVPGVQATGIVGTAHSQVALIGSISLVSANGVGYAGDIGTPLLQPLTGNEAAGAVGTIIAENDQTMTGVQGTGGAGTVIGQTNVDIELAGAEATGAAGDINGAFEVTFDGVSGFAVAGTLNNPTVEKLLVGIFANGFAGPVTKLPDQATAVLGVEATGGAGACTDYRVDKTLDGVEASGQTGELPFELTTLLQTDALIGEAGDIVPEVDEFWQGVSAIGFAGRLHPNSALMDGAGAQGYAGDVIGKGRSRGGNQRLLPRLVKTENGSVLWYDVTPTP